MKKLYGYCTACEEYVYRLVNCKHGDGQVDSENNPVWLLANINDMTDDEIAQADNNKVRCGCALESEGHYENRKYN